MHTTLRVLILALPLSACAATSKSTPERTSAVKAADQTAVPPAPAPSRVAGVEFETEASIVSIQVRDMDAAKAWYQRVLGSQIDYELAEQGWCEVTTPASGLLLGLSLNPSATPSGSTAMGFGVQDMTAAKAWLVKNEVSLERDVITIPGVVHLLYFADPDGNTLWFYQPL